MIMMEIDVKKQVGELMSKNLITLNKQADLKEVEQLFNEYSIRHIPIVEGKAIIGIISENDLARISFIDSYLDSEDPIETPIYDLLDLEQIMIKDPLCIPMSTTVEQATELLIDKDFHALPVVDDQEELVGIVTSTDLLKYYLNSTR
jgi:CBS domain-containing protein